MSNKKIVQVRQEVSAQWSSPLPPPQVLEAYKQASPEALNKVLTLIETQINFNIKHTENILLEQSKINRADERLALVSRIIAAIVSIACLILCGFVAYIGHPIIASTICGGELFALTAAFIYTAHHKK